MSPIHSTSVDVAESARVRAGIASASTVPSTAIRETASVSTARPAHSRAPARSGVLGAVTLPSPPLSIRSWHTTDLMVSSSASTVSTES